MNNHGIISRNRKHKIAIFLLLIGSCFLSIVLIEVIFRIFHPWFGKCDLVQSDSLLRLKLKQNLSGYCSSNGGILTSATTDYLGFRTHQSQSFSEGKRFKILLVGDSMTFGYGVSDSETIAAYLEDELNKTQAFEKGGVKFEVINGAVPGYGTIQEKLLFEQKANQLDPNLVLLNFFVTNDLRDNLEFEKFILSSQSGRIHTTIKLRLLEDLHAYVFLSERLKVFFIQNQRLYILANKFLGSSRRILPEMIFSWYNMEQFTHGWEVTEEALAAFSQGSTPFALVVTPSRIQLDRHYTNSAEALARQSTEWENFFRNQDFPQQVLASWAKRESVPFIDLRPALTTIDERSYHYPDGHLNKSGNLAVAREIASFLKTNKLVPEE